MSYKQISPIPVIEGGTQLKAWGTAYGLLFAGTTTINPVQVLSSLGATSTILTSGGAAPLPSWTTATYPATTTTNQLLYSNGANNIVGLATANNGVLITSGAGAPSISSTLPSAVQSNITTVGTITSGTWNGSVIGLTYGGTNANLTASNGGIFYSTASAGAILAATATANQVLLSGSNAAPAWSTATYPATTTINQILYSSSNNVIAGITTGNNGIVLTSGSGVPSVATTFGQGLAVASSQLSVGGANNIPFNDTKGIQDSNGNKLLTFSVTASAVNYLTITNRDTAKAPILSATGTDTDVTLGVFTKGIGQIQFGSNAGANTLATFSPIASAVNYVLISSAVTGTGPSIQGFGTDTNVVLNLTGRGNGGVAVQGTTAGGNAASGNVGELISSVINNASAVSILSNTPKNLTSISLTAGDWDVFGNITFIQATVTLQNAFCWISTTSATLPDASLYNDFTTSTSQMAQFGLGAPYFRASISTTTTVYLSGQVALAAGTCVMCGGIYARRVR